MSPDRGRQRLPVAADTRHSRLKPIMRQLPQEVHSMIRWNPRFARLFMVLGAIASFAIAAGAGCRWGD